VIPPIGENVMDGTLSHGTKFSEMPAAEKLVFCAKLCFFFVSFGFAFPTILRD
jgi:hypothetical protein